MVEDQIPLASTYSRIPRKLLVRPPSSLEVILKKGSCVLKVFPSSMVVMQLYRYIFRLCECEVIPHRSYKS